MSIAIILGFVSVAFFITVLTALAIGDNSKKSYEYDVVRYQDDTGVEERSGWCERVGYCGEMMYFRWADEDGRWEIPQSNIIEVERGEWHTVDSMDELPDQNS